MKKVVLIAAASLWAASASMANAETTGMSVKLPHNGNQVTVTALTPNIIRVSNVAPGEVTPPSQTLLQPGDEGKSATVVTKTPLSQMFTTPTGVDVRLDGRTGEVLIHAGKGKGIYDNGVRATDSKGRRTMELLPVESNPVYFGAGERGHAMNLMGDTLYMYNTQNYGYTNTDPRIKQMNITMPLLVSPNGYAIVFDDFAAGELITENPLKYATEANWPVDYYFVNAPDGLAGLPRELSKITGRQDLPPMWSLGYITSKYGYRTAEETDSVVNILKRKGYPLDGIVLDLYWYGIEQDMGRLDWEPSQWGDHAEMLANLKNKGVNLVAISQPYVLRNGKGIDNYNYLDQKGMFAKDSVGNTQNVVIWVGEGGMFDVANPDTRAWLRERYKKLTDEGITGWWGDLGEPEKHPEGARHANGLDARRYHNLYGNDWSRIIYDLFKEEYPDRRLMTLMRGGTVGLQRYSVYPWSTDVSRSWGGLQPQVKIMLHSGMSGLGYMSHDVGGFAIDDSNPVEDELYIRWLQLGLYSPVLRTHAQTAPEPYLYTGYQDIILPLVKERYRILPYLYTLAYQNSSEGLPIVRPIGMYTTAPADYADVDDQYLFGRDMMVAPVMEKGAVSRRVRFPQGEWVDINNPQNVYKGDTTVVVDAPLSVIPVFARGGALLPKADYSMENTGDYDASRYLVDYYPVAPCTAHAGCAKCAAKAGKSSFEIFEDDRRTPGTLERGEYAILKLGADNTGSSITLTAEVAGEYPDMPAKRELTFVVHNVDRPGSVHAVGAKLRKNYDPATRELRLVLVGWQPSKTPVLTVTADFGKR